MENEVEELLRGFVNNFRPSENWLVDMKAYSRARDFLISKAKHVECNFCSWIGRNDQLEKNGHCPNCQSPSTKKHKNYENTKRKSNSND